VPKKNLAVYLKWVNCGNASNTNHASGRASAQIIADSKANIARHMSVSPDEIYFTACASEANNIILQGVAHRHSGHKIHITCSSVEHKCVLKTCEELAASDKNVAFSAIPANSYGEITVKAVASQIRDNTVLVSVMYANNEIGNVNDIKGIGALIKRINKTRPTNRKIHFHVDAVAAIGRRIISPRKLGVHSMSISAHKFHGVKGVGMLYISKETINGIQPLTYGGGQGHVRSGTDNTPAIATMSAALTEVHKNRARKNIILNNKRNSILRSLRTGLAGTDYSYHVYGPPPQQKKHIESTILMTFIHKNKTLDVCNKKLVSYLDTHGISVSIGSSCNTKDPKASHVLYAIGAGDSHQKKSGTIRITMSDYTTMPEIRKLTTVISRYFRQPSTKILKTSEKKTA